jgi:hypothetical protein
MMFRFALALAGAAALASVAPAAAHPDAVRSCGLFTDRSGERVGAVVVRGPASRPPGACCGGT